MTVAKSGNGSSALLDEVLPTPKAKRPAFDMTKNESVKRLAAAMDDVAKEKKGKKQETGRLSIRPLNLKRVIMFILGTSPLIQHKFSRKSEEQMILAQTEEKDLVAGIRRAKRNPEEEFKEAMHTDNDGNPVIPCYALKACILTAVKSLPGNEKGQVLAKGKAGGMLQIANAYAPLIAPPAEMRTDIGRIGPKKTPYPIFRPQWFPWASVFAIDYNADIVTDQDLANLTQLAGFCAGLHEWRAEKGGGFGMFELATLEEITKMAKEFKVKLNLPKA